MLNDLNSFVWSFFKIKERFGILNFGHCYLFDICELLFGIYTTVFETDCTLRGETEAGS